MESSFKKGYDKKVNADGSFELSFKSYRLLPGVMTVILPLVLYPVSCAISFPFVGGVNVSKDLTSLITWNISAFIVEIIIFVCLYRLFIKKRNQIKVNPNIGISFNGKQLPFKDINSIGTITDLNKGAFIYAATHGI
ncbi:MAG: hypothetical protein H7Z76_07205, partial [Methylotenera sp.]|nr:hypothetical protein [Flavobacterium sp.]